jgi:RES domain-containing protein
MPTAWRLVKERYAATAFSGEGAAKVGGRWNSRGVRVVYVSGTRALAVLESLVHLNPSVPFQYVAIPVTFETAWVERFPLEELPPNWRESPPPPAAQQIGDAWVRAGRSVVLALPSVIVPEETNYLLNPAHPDFPQLRLGPAEPFAYDPRLLA